MMYPALMLAAVLAQTPSLVDQAVAEFPAADQRLVFRVREGLMKKEAARTITEHLGTLEACRAFAQLGRTAETIDCVRGVIAADPARMAQALPTLWSISPAFGEDSRDHSAQFKSLAAVARGSAATLPREERAAAEFALVPLDARIDPSLRGQREQDQIASLVQSYAETKAAVEAQIDRVYLLRFDDRLRALDDIVRAHPATDIAAHALYQKAFQLGHNAPVSGPDVQWDPTDRFLQTIEIVKDLESGRYGKSEWVSRAPSLVTGFYAYKPQYAPENIEKVLDGYATFLKTHFAVDQSPFGNGSGYVITSKMPELFKLKNDPDGVERTFRSLEAESPDPAGARYLHAVYRSDRDTLTSIADSAGPYARRALATLATLQVESREYEPARDSYQRYVRLYPQSPYAWVAALRAAEADLALGHSTEAEAAFERVPQAYANNALAVVLGHALAARSSEVQAAPDKAAPRYSAALRAWDEDYGLDYSLDTPSRQTNGNSSAGSPHFVKADVRERMAHLEASLAQPGGAMVEHARWLLGERDRAGAESALKDMIGRFPRSPLVPEARLLMHRAQLGLALDSANIERAGGDPARARTTLDALAREPFDPAVAAARIARASMAWTAGDGEPAKADLRAALQDWLANQTLQLPKTDLEKDVAAIRETVFQPLGGAVYSTERGWNAFQWPTALPAYVFVNPEVQVKLSSGETIRVSVSKSMPAAANVLYADSSQIALLGDIVFSLGGTKRRAPGAIMETPNQPVGPSMNIIGLWNEFFPCRPGHWGGWEFLTYPVVTRIEFLDAARTQAAVAVTIGYSGATVVCEKVNGVWKAIRLTNWWIT